MHADIGVSFNYKHEVPVGSDVVSWITLPRLETASRHICQWLGLEPWCLGLGLDLSVSVLPLPRGSVNAVTSKQVAKSKLCG